MSAPNVYDVVPQTPTLLQSPAFSPRSASSTHMLFESHEPINQAAVEAEQASQLLKTRIRQMRLVARIATTCLAAATLVLETKIIFTYNTTRLIQRNNRGPWAKQTSLWPSIMLLSASGVTVIIGIFMILAYIRASVRAANRIHTVQQTVSTAVEFTQVVLWVTVAIMYKKGKTGKDLWGWACSPTAQKIQGSFDGVVDFEITCGDGSSNWRISIANAICTVFGLSIWWFVWKRRQHQKLRETQEEPVKHKHKQKAKCIVGQTPQLKLEMVRTMASNADSRKEKKQVVNTLRDRPKYCLTLG